MKIAKKIFRKLFGLFGFEILRSGGAVPLDYYNYRRMSYSNVARFLYFNSLFNRVKDIEGDIVECGVAGGKTFSYLAFLSKYESKGRKVWAFDSFEGLPSPTMEDGVSAGFRGKFSAKIGLVMGLLQEAELDDDFIKTQVRFVPGFFEDTMKNYRGPGIALLHIDVDLYKSYKTVLEALYPKVVPGGIIAFDEYLRPTELSHYPEAHKAIDEYLGDKKYLIETDRVTGKFFLVKPN